MYFFFSFYVLYSVTLGWCVTKCPHVLKRGNVMKLADEFVEEHIVVCCEAPKSRPFVCSGVDNQICICPPHEQIAFLTVLSCSRELVCKAVKISFL